MDLEYTFLSSSKFCYKMDISRKDEQSTSTAQNIASMLNDKDVEDLCVKKLKDLQQRNTELLNITNKQFAAAVKQVEVNFRGTMPQPVCQELQEEVLKCYQDNAGDILNCSPLVTAFTSCVNRARIDQTLFHMKEVRLLEVLRKIAEENELLQVDKQEE